jgi:hypothetical protein
LLLHHHSPSLQMGKLLSKMLCLGQALVIIWLLYYKAMGSLSSHLGACLTLIGTYRNYFGKCHYIISYIQ